MLKVRVRFAPSPTGYFHIGGARTALFNWLYAKHTGGTFVLRIEDSDMERNTKESLQSLLTNLRWLGLHWDEGPEVGGAYGSYFQSERNDIYQHHLQILKDAGRVYEKEGALWLKVSGKMQTIDDIIHGPVQRLEEKDFVIYRSNGTPVFHFVNVVDDITMKITHVIRGEDHLSNTSKHLELYQAFGVPAPKFAHIPLILKTDGPGKMSKRDRGSLVEEYRNKFFLPEALINYLSLLGWSPKDDREFLSLEEIIQAFDLVGINKTHARFDERKLSFLNAEHMKHLPKEEFFRRGVWVLQQTNHADYVKNEPYLQQIFAIVQEKLRSFEELPHFISYFFDEQYPFEPTALQKVAKHQPQARLVELQSLFQSLPSLDTNTVETAIQSLSKEKNLPAGDYIHTLRFAISGRTVGPSLYHMLGVLGKEIVLKRIQRCVEAHLFS
ncbi:MAG: glutamate--tRNA ligase [Opitutales bacterium]|nr:glutamate--tRNA ligase [Opitutales bacterium]